MNLLMMIYITFMYENTYRKIVSDLKIIFVGQPKFIDRALDLINRTEQNEVMCNNKNYYQIYVWHNFFRKNVRFTWEKIVTIKKSKSILFERR